MIAEREATGAVRCRRGASRAEQHDLFGAVACRPTVDAEPRGDHWYSTFRARIGYGVAPTWLIYLTGGLAVGEIKSTTNIQFGTDQIGLGNFSGSDTVTRLGWTVGAGIGIGFVVQLDHKSRVSLP